MISQLETSMTRFSWRKPRHGNDDTETGNHWPTIAASTVSHFWHSFISQQPKIQYYAVFVVFFLMGDLLETFSWKIEFLQNPMIKLISSGS